MIKSLIRRLIGETNVGRLDYLLKRNLKDAWGPLNGQSFRQRVYREIIDRIPFDAIVETGTFRGTTTEYFAQTGLPVYTVEIHPRAYGYASMRFRNRRQQIHLREGDSPKFLRDLANDPGFPKSKVFFYLDAHIQDSSRYYKAPLVEELEIIFTKWSEAVVMIDDFEVPGTTYSFDDWGPDRSLNLACLDSLRHLSLVPYFPNLDPEHETGAKRGWVVVCREPEMGNVFKEIRTLRCGVTASAV